MLDEEEDGFEPDGESSAILSGNEIDGNDVDGCLKNGAFNEWMKYWTKQVGLQATIDNAVDSSKGESPETD